MTYLHQFFFGYFPYVALGIFVLGSALRYDRDQYSWKADSSQLLSKKGMRWGSNLFHIGIIFLFFGHFVGLLTPEWVYHPFMTPGFKQVMNDFSPGEQEEFLRLFKKLTSNMSEIRQGV